jgi:hypothetical protein
MTSDDEDDDGRFEFSWSNFFWLFVTLAIVVGLALVFQRLFSGA